jgi:hypothetical protein
MRWNVVILVGLGLFALLSVTDWVMTFALLRLHPGAVESNPVAAACLERYGWEGLALYKTGSVLVFLGAVYLLARRRPAVAACVVAFGCAALLAVTTYSHDLIREAHQERKQLAETEFPKPKKKKATTFNGIPIPETCWFAESRPVSTASRE